MEPRLPTPDSAIEDDGRSRASLGSSDSGYFPPNTRETSSPYRGGTEYGAPTGNWSSYLPVTDSVVRGDGVRPNIGSSYSFPNFRSASSPYNGDTSYGAPTVNGSPYYPQLAVSGYPYSPINSLPSHQVPNPYTYLMNPGDLAFGWDPNSRGACFGAVPRYWDSRLDPQPVFGPNERMYAYGNVGMITPVNQFAMSASLPPPQWQWQGGPVAGYSFSPSQAAGSGITISSTNNNFSTVHLSHPYNQSSIGAPAHQFFGTGYNQLDTQLTPPIRASSLDLNQYEAIATTPNQVGLVSAISGTSSLVGRMENLNVQCRNSSGTSGTSYKIKANHFHVEFVKKELHRYTVCFESEPSSTNHGQKFNKRAAFNELWKTFESEFAGCYPAYDGVLSMFIAGSRPFETKIFHVVYNEGIFIHRLKVTIANPSGVPLQKLYDFRDSFSKDSVLVIPTVVLRAFNAFLCTYPLSLGYTQRGPSFFSSKFGDIQNVGNCLEVMHGFYHKMVETREGLTLNTVKTCTTLIRQQSVIEFVKNSTSGESLLSSSDRVKIMNALNCVKIVVPLPGFIGKTYWISGLTSKSVAEISFHDYVDDKITKISMIDYFRFHYQFEIHNLDMPCVDVGSGFPRYLPMEVCQIIGGQFYSSKLDGKDLEELLVISRQNPSFKETELLKVVDEIVRNRFFQEFGLKIDANMILVDARVLPTPQLNYNMSGHIRNLRPVWGIWNMNNKRFYDAGKVHQSVCFNFDSNVINSEAKSFCEELAHRCTELGMDFVSGNVPTVTMTPDLTEDDLTTELLTAIAQQDQNNMEKTDLLIFVIPNKWGPLYGTLKRICETNIGYMSQCILGRTFSRKKKKDKVLSYLCLKLNMKFGGSNNAISNAVSMTIPSIEDCPTMILGADVSHFHSDILARPSIAAVVGSQNWPEMTKYVGKISAQDRAVEQINDLVGSARDLISSFEKENGCYPKKIIFYRDGIPDNKFDSISKFEIAAIKEAYHTLCPNHEPFITYIVVQKRHKTRFFPNDHSDKKRMDRSGNILTGTVVDTKVCHPMEFDFFLNSHPGESGTSRPSRYRVVSDENHFTAEGLQTFTYQLCFTYSRCTKAVSIVPPVFYAHLLAYHARFFMAPNDTGEMHLLQPCSPVKEVMFFT